ncbi:thiolase family protein [Hydrocarboniphaga sp.]|uniref:thiolase family protein n=1 Tax=Hydrocarboniphaga sp. TaxID=2033016 RepID=UPI00261C0BC0|nr:thiolase family protein [Hydrocarboniphaga sp.]
MDLALQASLAAIADAGLVPAEIDGLACWPGRVVEMPGASPVSAWEIKDALGLNLTWYGGGAEGPAQLSSLLNACAAIAAGYARHVLCFRATTEAPSSNRHAGVRNEAVPRVNGWQQWLLPFDALSTANWVALSAQRHFFDYGTTREQLAWVAINARRNAALNPIAVYKDPLTLDAYLAARFVSSPLCLYDCDVPVNGAVAFVVSAAAPARDRPRPPIWVEAISGALQRSSLWDQGDLTAPAAFDAAKHLWNMTDLKPGNVDVAQLYDGFSIVTLNWLEALGFCGRGESGTFVEGGRRIALDGALPLNTSGGQLSGGRLHGLGLLHEAVTQLRGDAGARQIARPARVAAVANGAGPLASCALLVRD